jgi:hypothetical protein
MNPSRDLSFPGLVWDIRHCVKSPSGPFARNHMPGALETLQTNWYRKLISSRAAIPTPDTDISYAFPNHQTTSRAPVNPPSTTSFSSPRREPDAISGRDDWRNREMAARDILMVKVMNWLAVSVPQRITKILDNKGSRQDYCTSEPVKITPFHQILLWFHFSDPWCSYLFGIWIDGEDNRAIFSGSWCQKIHGHEVSIPVPEFWGFYALKFTFFSGNDWTVKRWWHFQVSTDSARFAMSRWPCCAFIKTNAFTLRAIPAPV